MTLTIGTDCSGIEAPIEALKQLGIPFQHKWSCEIDKFARKSIMANSPPEVMYTDITQRDHSQLPDVDLYVCGFPCQSFSTMGRKLGTRDPRSNVMLECIDVIKTKKPNVFLLENVKNFKFIEDGKPFKFLRESLEGILDESGKPTYNLYADIYNTKAYGIPQHRERLYIVGIKKGVQVQRFNKPGPKPLQPFDDFILDKTLHECNVADKILHKKMQQHQLGNTVITPFNFCSWSVERRVSHVDNVLWSFLFDKIL